MWYRVTIVVAMLLAAFLLVPYTLFIFYPVIAGIAYLLFGLLLAGFNRLFPQLQNRRGNLVCLAVFLTLLLGQFLYFNSRARLAKEYLGDLSERIEIVDHYVTYRYDPSYAFLVENSDGVLEALLKQKPFGEPMTNNYIPRNLPQRFAEPFQGLPHIKYQYINEMGAVFTILVSGDKKLLLYRIQHT